MAEAPLSLEEIAHNALSFRVNGIQLASSYDPRAEALLQAEVLPREAQLTLYGMGLGHLPELLLRRSELTELRIILLNRALFLTLLSRLDMSAWLQDERLELGLGVNVDRIETPSFALPGDLGVAEDGAWKIRDHLVARAQEDFVNRRFSVDNPELRERINANRQLVDLDRDVSELFGSCPGREFWVVGSGPSLSESAPKLALRQSQGAPEQRPLVIAADTALRPLLGSGLKVDYVVSIDPFLKLEYFDGVATEELALIYFPLVPPEVLTAFRGTRFTALSRSPLYEALRAAGKGELWSGGSVIHPAIDLAVQMGASKVTLAGVDFAFVYGRTHAGWEDGELGKDLLKARHWVKSWRGEKLRTNPNFAGYLCALEDYIRSRPRLTFLSASDRGALIAGASVDSELI